MTKKIIKVGSRDSQLALWQTRYAIEQLKKVFTDTEFEIVDLKTKGDKILDVSLSKIGDKGLFTNELEAMMLSGEIDAARGDDWQWIQEILALPAHTRYIKAAGDEAMVCSAAMRETWPGRWHDLLRARVQDVIDALVSHEREIRAMDPGMFARMPSPSLCDRVRKRHDPNRKTLGMTVQELAR